MIKKEQTDANKNNTEPVHKKEKRLLGLSDSKDEDVAPSKEELARYRAEPIMKGDGCPFQRWRRRCGSCSSCSCLLFYRSSFSGGLSTQCPQLGRI